MQQIFDIHDYDEHFLEQFTSHLIPIYDLWSIRPLQNEQKELISGSSEEVEKFRNFIIDHTNKDYPHPLIIVIGNSEKGNSKNMSNTTKRYFKIKFEKFKGNDLGSPLSMGYSPPFQTGNEQMIPISFYGSNMQRQPMNGMQGFSLGDIQGIIDRNVNDAARSIKAEYEELSAKREVESIKRIAELETRMELHKLELREKEVENKERQLQDEIDAFEEKKAEGLGTVKDYTKTIASGLMELGKAAFGLDAFDKDKKDKPGKSKGENKSGKEENLKGGTKNKASFDDEGFSETTTENKAEKKENTKETVSEQRTKSEEAFESLADVIKTLSEDQKMSLMEMLMPEEEEENQQNDTTENSQENNQNNEKNENVQS